MGAGARPAEGSARRAPDRAMAVREPAADAAFHIDYRGDGLTAAVLDPSQTILGISRLYKLPHFSECGGRGRCTTCRIRVLDGLGHLTPRTRRENAMAEARGWDEYIRLACQTRVRGDVVVQRLVRSGADVSRLQAELLHDEPGREVPMAVLFCDLRNFTALSQRHAAYDVVHILNRFYERIGEAVVCNAGYIFQYAGDALVAWFGVAGGEPAVNCRNAVRAALAMEAILDDVNRGLEQDFGISLEISTGIHFGPTIVGNIGHASNKQLTAVGDAVNVASRIETMNRELGTRLLVSGELEAKLDVPLAAGQRAEVNLRGREGPTALVEVRGFAEPDPWLPVQTSLERVLGNPGRFGERFYALVFEKLPEARGLFRGNMEAQAAMFVDMLRMVLHGLTRFDELAPGLRQSGRRHTGYGVEPEHYAVIQEALLQTMREMLGEDDPEIERAWREVMTRVCDTMIAGARRGGPAARRNGARAARA